jgi:hypothetical protein
MPSPNTLMKRLDLGVELGQSLGGLHRDGSMTVKRGLAKRRKRHVDPPIVRPRKGLPPLPSSSTSAPKHGSLDGLHGAP